MRGKTKASASAWLCRVCATFRLRSRETRYDGAFCIVPRAVASEISDALATRGVVSYVVPRHFLRWNNFSSSIFVPGGTTRGLTPCREVIQCNAWALVRQLVILIKKAPAACAAVLRKQIVDLLCSQLEAQMQPTTCTPAEKMYAPPARSPRNPLPNPTWVGGWSTGLQLQAPSFHDLAAFTSVLLCNSLHKL